MSLNSSLSSSFQYTKLATIVNMSSSYTATEVHYHVRSISLPSRLHPSFHKIEKELKRLKTWDASQISVVAATPLQTEAIKAGLAGLAELHNCVLELIGSPLTQQALLHQCHKEEKHVAKALDMSIGFLDICGSARELLLLMKEHVLDLQSALRRKGLDSSINDHICAYICFRKKAGKDISTSLKALKTMESSIKSCPLLHVDHHLLMVINVLRELSTITISFFRKLLPFMCEPVLKKSTSVWSLFSFHRCSRKSDDKVDLQIVKGRLVELDESIRELEAGLDCLFRCLVKQRVSLLNLLTP